MTTHGLRVVILLVASCAASAQGQSTFGTILGTVRDPSGAVVAASAATAKGLDTGISIQVVSGGEGLYEFPPPS